MNKVIQIAVTAGIVLVTGCSTGWVNSSLETTTSTVAFDGTPKTVTEKNDVLAVRGSVLVSAEVEKANVKWGEVEISVGGLSSTGDSVTTKILTDAIVQGILAGATYGTEPAIRTAVSSAILLAQKNSATNAPVPAVKE
jgi:hypothetical protein